MLELIKGKKKKKKRHSKMPNLEQQARNASEDSLEPLGGQGCSIQGCGLPGLPCQGCDFSGALRFSAASLSSAHLKKRTRPD